MDASLWRGWNTERGLWGAKRRTAWMCNAVQTVCAVQCSLSQAVPAQGVYQWCGVTCACCSAMRCQVPLRFPPRSYPSLPASPLPLSLPRPFPLYPPSSRRRGAIRGRERGRRREGEVRRGGPLHPPFPPPEKGRGREKGANQGALFGGGGHVRDAVVHVCTANWGPVFPPRVTEARVALQ